MKAFKLKVERTLRKNKLTVNARFNLALNRRFKDLPVSPDCDDSADFILEVECRSSVCN